jgi:hypothetical protein
MPSASSYEVTTLRPRAAVGRHQGVRPTSHSQGTFGSRGRRVRPVRGVAHSHSQGYSQRGRGFLRRSYSESCIETCYSDRVDSLKHLGVGEPGHYKSHVRIKMCSGAYPASCRNTANGAGVGRSYGPRSIIRGPAVLASVCVEADLSHCLTYGVRRGVEGLFVGYRDV